MATKEEAATAQVGKWLALGQATFVAFAGAIGVTSGAITRIFRNSPGEAVVWLAFITFGILMGVVVSNESTAGVRLHIRHLLLAAAGTVAVGLAALWDVLGMGTADESASLASVRGSLSFIGSLPWWLFLLAYLVLLAGVGGAFGSRGTGQPSDKDSPTARLSRFFDRSWFGLYWLVVTIFLMFVGPSPRAVASMLGVLLIVGAITWAVDEKPESPEPPAAKDPEQTVNVNLRMWGEE